MDPAQPEAPTPPPRAGPTDAVRPADYRDAAAARLDEAQRLLDSGSPGMALYLAGVAAECVLRSELPLGLAFDGRHDLQRLAEAGLLGRRETPQVRQQRSAVAQVNRLWRNSFRYMADAKIARVLHRQGFEQFRPDRGLRLVFAAASAVVAFARFLYDSTGGRRPQEADNGRDPAR